MFADKQVEAYISKVEETINAAQKDLFEVKIIREYDPTDYSHAMQQLQQLQEDLVYLLPNASPKDRETLIEAHNDLKQMQEIMIKGI